MTDKVIPSYKGDSDAYIVATLIAEAGGSSGWIQKSSETLLADDHGSISGEPLNAFQQSSSSSSFDVTIDTGEAFVSGAWVARDTTTTVTLSSSTNGQSVYLGWDKGETDTVIIGKSSAFASADKKMEIFQFDTDSNGVTSVTDQRTIGKSSSLGQVELDDDSKLGRWLSTAVASSANGTLGGSNNEIFRAPGGTSDLVMSVQDGSGKMNLAYNAYYDGSDWRYMVDNEEAYLISFSNGVSLQFASTGTADNIISFSEFKIDADKGDLYVDNTQIYDESVSEVPQSRLGGPAASLSGYPLNTGDIDGSGGSGGEFLKTDGTQDGITWDTVPTSGEWSNIVTLDDTDGSTETTLSYDFAANNDVYNIYKADVIIHNTDGTEWNSLAAYVNDNTQSIYESVEISDNGVNSRIDENAWEDLVNAGINESAHGTFTIRGDYPIGVGDSGTRNPTIASNSGGSIDPDGQLVYGAMNADITSVDKLTFTSDNHTMECRINIKGKDL